ncbi:MAG: Leucine-rich repeat (LRR) protein [Arcticibacterium sp.]
MNVQFNRLSQMPKSLKKLKGLEDLYLGNNYLSNLHTQKLKKVPPLKRLDLYNRGLMAFPEDLGVFEGLEELDVYYNELTALSPSVGQLKNLKTLAVANNNFWKLPSEISQLTKLKTLYAHHNKLYNLPELPTSLRLFVNRL